MFMRKVTVLSGVLLLAGFGGSACSKEATASSNEQRQSPAVARSAPQAEPPADPAREAKKVFETRCAVCHGATGRGDGPGAAALTPRPQNFSDPAWQTSLDDAALERVIVEGGAAVGKSSAMPPNADLRGKQPVLEELAKLIRGFGK